MNENSELCKIIKLIINVDIAFILNDIIGDFTDPEFPKNIFFDNFTIHVETPHGICTITIINTKDKKEVRFQRSVSDTFYEEYRLDLSLQSDSYFCVDGKTVELREKGFIINDIDKKYIYDEEKLEVIDLKYILKNQQVYLNRELDKLSKGKKLTNNEIFALLGSVDNDNNFGLNDNFTNTLSMSLPINQESGSTYAYFINFTINSYDHSWIYSMNSGKNLIGRAYNLYQGIVNQENYDDAVALIKSNKFSIGFSYEDYRDGSKSFNTIIEELIGPPTLNYRKEYSALVRQTIEIYYNKVKNNPFLFEEFSFTSKDKKRELKKNKYIEEILLSNRDDIYNYMSDTHE